MRSSPWVVGLALATVLAAVPGGSASSTLVADDEALQEHTVFVRGHGGVNPFLFRTGFGFHPFGFGTAFGYHPFGFGTGFGFHPFGFGTGFGFHRTLVSPFGFGGFGHPFLGF